MEDFITDMREKSSQKLHDTTLLLGSGITFHLEAHKCNYGQYIYWIAKTDRPMCGPYDTVHPFWGIYNSRPEVLDACYAAAIVADNDITRCILHNLSLADEDLTKKTGQSTPEDYRAHMLAFLGNLWD